MRKVDVKLSAIEWCGYEEYYEMEVPENYEDDEIEDLALEKFKQDFCDTLDLIPNGEGEYVVMGEEDEESSSIVARVVY